MQMVARRPARWRAQSTTPLDCAPCAARGGNPRGGTHPRGGAPGQKRGTRAQYESNSAPKRERRKSSSAAMMARYCSAEQRRREKQEPRVVRRGAEAERDAEVSQVERIAGEGVGPRRVQRGGDELLVLAGSAVGHLPQDPRAQRLAGDAEQEAQVEPRRGSRPTAANEQRHRRGEEEHRREAAPAEEESAERPHRRACVPDRPAMLQGA